MIFCAPIEMDALASGAIFRLTNTAVLRSPMPRHVMLSSSSGSSGSGSSSNSALPLTPSSLNGNSHALARSCVTDGH